MSTDGKLLKKKKVSKKNKKAWRKFTDIKDVEEFLDDKRLEERLGGSYSERSDKELFHVDHVSGTSLDVKAEILARRRAKFSRPYRCLQALEPSTAVPDPITKRNKGKPFELRKSEFVKKMEELNKSKDGVNKLLTAMRNRKTADAQRKARLTRFDFKNDLWEDSSDRSPSPSKTDCKWLRKDAYLHVLNNTGNRVKKKPKTMTKKSSNLAPVEAPHPGTSYNPSLEEHSELLSKAAQEELKVMKEEEHLKRVVTDMIPKVTVQEVEENWMKEMSQGLDPSEEESSSEGGEDNDFVGNAIVSREKKKTLQKRRKIKEAKLEAVKRKESKMERKKLSDIDRLSVVKKELKKEENKLQLLRTKREKAKKAKAVQPKVLSKHKFEPLETEFSLGSELSGNLRNIKPEGSILKDRFRRMQERNIVEPRVKQTKRLKYKRKIIQKASYKMP